MKIGEDFEKIKWTFEKWEFLEPNAFIGDTFLFILAIFLALKISRVSDGSAFYNNWIKFYVVMGISLFMGGLGHLLYQYWGPEGKYFSWYTAIIAIYFIEKALLELHPSKNTKQYLTSLSIAKLILAITALTVVIMSQNLAVDSSKGLAIPSINSAVGMLFSLVYLGQLYQNKGLGNFNYFLLGVIIILPSAFFQFLKINFAVWFDRNDISHLLLAFGFIMFATGIIKFSKPQNAPHQI
jgi:hypothetical protein